MWIDYNEKYEVSSDGHIRNKKSGRILHEFINKNGYLITQFDGKTRTVHRVVASVYLDNPNKCEDINHKDGNKRNNSVENLEWCTRSENMKHAYKLGLKISKGEKNGNHKLSKEDVKHIVSIYKKGDAKYGAKALAKKFNVAPQTICAVVSGQNWK